MKALHVNPTLDRPLSGRVDLTEGENDMKKILRKGAILLVIFVAVVACTSLLMNSQSTDNRSDMNDATLPEVMVKLGSTQANKMYGYRQSRCRPISCEAVLHLWIRRKS